MLAYITRNYKNPLGYIKNYKLFFTSVIYIYFNKKILNHKVTKFAILSILCMRATREFSLSNRGRVQVSDVVSPAWRMSKSNTCGIPHRDVRHFAMYRKTYVRFFGTNAHVMTTLPLLQDEVEMFVSPPIAVNYYRKNYGRDFFFYYRRRIPSHDFC